MSDTQQDGENAERWEPQEVAPDGWPTREASMSQLYILTGADDDETVLALAAHQLTEAKAENARLREALEQASNDI